MPNITLLDIDYTLIDTAVSKRLCKEKLTNYLNISEKLYDTVVEEYAKTPQGFTDFRPQEFINHLANKFSSDSKEIGNIFFDDNNFINALYQDTVSTLEVLGGKYTLGIFSEGFYDFQVLKLHKSGILKYFDNNHMYIFRRKLVPENLNKLPRETVVVDDNIYVIEALKELGNFKPIWINRKSKERKNTTIETIFELSQLKNVLR